jgi:hypothetical protein
MRWRTTSTRPEGNALAERLAVRIVERRPAEEPTWRPSLVVVIAWLAVAAVAFAVARALV